LNLDSISTLLELSMALSAWKESGPDRWALRCNPSSGNLHPTEVYVVAQQIEGLASGVYHYVSRDHVLEQRCLADVTNTQPVSALWIGLTSIHWREAWKYGERAFRYCQLDVGHALGALRYAAAVNGWSVQLVEACGDSLLAGMLGVNRSADFGKAEPESPELLLRIIPHADPQTTQRSQAMQQLPTLSLTHWQGHANVLDSHHMYAWPLITEADIATRAPHHALDDVTDDYGRHYPPLMQTTAKRAVDIIRNRRSAQHFDRKFTLSAVDFHDLLDGLLARPQLPWDAWRYAARIHPIIFVHRVEGLTPGLYALVRNPHSIIGLQQALRREFLWRPVDSAPEHLPLHQLYVGDCRQIAKNLSCHQAIAADSCFSMAMLAEFEPLIQNNPWRYRQLYWEAGLLGQALYLAAEAASVRGTGIGCFLDDVVHELLGVQDQRYQSLYHFTVGRPVTDERMSSSPPYSEQRRLGLIEDAT